MHITIYSYTGILITSILHDIKRRRRIVCSYNGKNINISASSILKKMRKNLGITETELAKKLKISQQQVSRYENGKTSLTLERISTYLSILEIEWPDFIAEVLDGSNCSEVNY
ncbi:helix-turn-helix transcriptional regulator [Providencia rettgeri]|nr:helix-turn-helix transcriptional regulator [Providencia rettgeri]